MAAMLRWTDEQHEAWKARQAREYAQQDAPVAHLVEPVSKYRNKRTNGYASKREAKRAAELRALQDAGAISDLQEQVPFLLVPKAIDETGNQGRRECGMPEQVVIGDATLILGDCLDILPTLPKVDAVITDPPYGIGIAANPFRQKHEAKAWDNAPASSLHITACLAAAPVCLFWGGNYFDLPPTQGFLIWDKVQPEDFSSAMCEYAWTNVAKPAKLYKRHVVSYEKHHPTTKPIELMRWCIDWIGEAPVVLDPFMGSGTTGVACAQLGRKFIGIEIERRYFDIACERIDNAYRQERLFA